MQWSVKVAVLVVYFCKGLGFSVVRTGTRILFLPVHDTTLRSCADLVVGEGHRLSSSDWDYPKGKVRYVSKIRLNPSLIRTHCDSQRSMKRSKT
jgi:hypothetical protein